jgi:D-alanine-D-alanine ligase
MKLKIGVIFGGQSLEHEVSIITAIQAMNNIDTEKYDIVPIYVTKDLVWYYSGCLRYIDSFNNFNLIEKYARKVNLVNKNGRFVLQTTGLFKREWHWYCNSLSGSSL